MKREPFTEAGESTSITRCYKRMKIFTLLSSIDFTRHYRLQAVCGQEMTCFPKRDVFSWLLQEEHRRRRQPSASETHPDHLRRMAWIFVDEGQEAPSSHFEGPWRIRTFWRDRDLEILLSMLLTSGTGPGLTLLFRVQAARTDWMPWVHRAWLGQETMI